MEIGQPSSGSSAPPQSRDWSPPSATFSLRTGARAGRVYERMVKGEAGEKDEQVEEVTCKMIVGRWFGSFPAVKKVLLSVSSCVQDSPRVDAANTNVTKRPGMMHHGNSMPASMELFHQRGYAPGKGGSIVRTFQNETGASIKIADVVPDSDEIQSRDTLLLRMLLCVWHSRIAEIGFEPGNAVVAQLLVHSQQIGCLLGRGGYIISEMRRATGASIHVFPREQAPKCGARNDEVVQHLLAEVNVNNPG
ncbi:hypothetical protein Patl1_22019 [Pistacia atlantica]|uniref:Uncharacterized protein n=1 Tax=Pistacia atlantica TaxID=434234 RepID=A0ACC1BH61_9ROSI|nr:hypothetical protein Patl1_22019 [Pistacia atlantica]